MGTMSQKDLEDDKLLWSIERQEEREAWNRFVEEVLPDVPDNKYFTRRAFVSDTFSVEHFVENRKDYPLEELRELLSAYLKKLRIASIDLINADYTDFVHLSSNLIALRKSIEKVYEPIVSARLEVIKVRDELKDRTDLLRDRISRLKEVSKKKNDIHQLLLLNQDLERIEDSLSTGLKDVRKSDIIYEKSIEEVINFQRILRNHTSFINNNSRFLQDMSCRVENIRKTLHMSSRLHNQNTNS